MIARAARRTSRDAEEHGRITRDDIERKFRELQGEVDTTTASATQYAVIVGAVAVVAVIGVAYLLGRRRGRRRSTVVEIRRM